MRWFTQLAMKTRMLFARGKASAHLDDELRFHVERQTAENIAAGMSADEAHYAALRAFGNPALLREQARATWSWGALESFARDLRYGIRTLRRTPGFTIIAILVMALGIGANVALFTVVRGVLLRPLPFKDPGRLVRIYEADAHNPVHNRVAVSGADFFDWQKQEHSFDEMALATAGDFDINLSGSGGQLPEDAGAMEGSWNLFPMLGVRPALGRLFTANDDSASAGATVVLTWGLWERRYGADPQIVGKTVLVNAKPYTVLGVLPAWFSYPNPTVGLWLPLFHENTWPGFRTAHAAHNFRVLARLAPGATIAQAKAEMDAIQLRIRQRFPIGPVFDATSIVPMLESEVGPIEAALYALFGASACLLLIACLNIANLLVARAASRRKETAIRAALGGSRAGRIKEQVVESLLLSIAGGGLGLLFAWLAVQWFVRLRADLPRVYAVQFDGGAILFGVGVILLCGIAAGLVPALSLDDKQVLRALQGYSHSQAGNKGTLTLRRTLLTLEVALTVVLLASAGLLMKSYQRLRSVDLGCATRNILTMGIDLPEARYKTPAQRLAFFEQLVERVRALPGVEAASLDTELPGTGYQRDDSFTIQENPPLPKGKYLDAFVPSVDPDYFRTMQIPLLRGRIFRPDERLGNANVAVVTAAFVHEFFPSGDAIGKHIDDANFNAPHGFEIVGVVGDTRQTIADTPRPAIYYPLYRGDFSSASLVIRARADAPGFAVPVQKIVAKMDPSLAVSDVLTMDQLLGQSTLDQIFDTTLLTGFAVLSLLLAAVGLFGVLSYIVAQRTSEIGIRIALGAQREQVLRLMLADGLRPALIGLALGLAASAAATRLIQSMLYETAPLDPAVFAAVAASLLAVAALACLVPAWRASRLDPVRALRTE
ncbi:MAG: ADOP family duplicated permease [Terracidiphilus sp.]